MRTDSSATAAGVHLGVASARDANGWSTYQRLGRTLRGSPSTTTFSLRRCWLTMSLVCVAAACFVGNRLSGIQTLILSGMGVRAAGSSRIRASISNATISIALAAKVGRWGGPLDPLVLGDTRSVRSHADFHPCFPVAAGIDGMQGAEGVALAKITETDELRERIERLEAVKP